MPDYSQMSDAQLRLLYLQAKSPDQMSDDELRTAFRQARLERIKASNPGEYASSSKAFQEKYGPTAGRSFAQNFTEGVGKSFVDTGRGLKQLAVEAGDKLGIISPTIQDTVRGETPTDRLRREASATAQQDAPLMRTGGGMTGYIGGQLAQTAVPVGSIPRAASLAGRVGTAAGVGAALANTQPVQQSQSRLTNTAIGAAGGALGEGLAAGIGRLAAPSPSVTPEVRALAQKAQQMGIPLRAEQVSQSRPLSGISAALDTVPFSGRDASREAQRAAFGRAVSNTLGENTDNLATAVKQAERTLGGKYDTILRSHAVKVGPEFSQDMANVLKEAQAELTDDQLKVISKQIDNIAAKTVNGEIEGQAAYNIKKMLDRISKSPDSSLAYHAGELRSSLLNALNRSLPEKVAREFADTKAKYANLITVRRMLKAGADGGLTPARLATAKNLRGSLKDVADVGATFLKEPFGNSGTANRMIGAGLLGGASVGALFEPTTLAATGGVIGAGRLANTALQSRPLVNYMLNGSPLLAAPANSGLLPILGASGAIASQ